MAYGQIKQSRIETKSARNLVTRNHQYGAGFFGFENLSGDGKYVRLCIIDSGLPDHVDVKYDESKFRNFTSINVDKDTYGHATAVSGIIGSSNKKAIYGMAVETDLYFAKTIIDNNYDNKIESVVDAILWSVVRDVDIILMSFGCEMHSDGLHDAIKKAHRHGIAMIAAAGNCTQKTKDVDYPARYDEVFSVGYANNISSNYSLKNRNNCTGVVMPRESYETTYKNSQFIKMEGSSINAAAVAGLAVLTHQSLRKKGIDPKKTQLLYNEIGKFVVKNN